MSLLPSRPDVDPDEGVDPRVIGVDSEAADEVLSALSSGTARQVLAVLHDDPAPPSVVADKVDTSLQNVQYHLDKLHSAGAVEVVDTAYSAKGREMDVYAPADRPLVIFAGDERRSSTLRQALSRLLGALGLLGLASVGVQALFGRGGFLDTGGFQAGGDGGAGGGGADITPTQTQEYDGDGGGGADSAVPGDGGAGGVTPTPDGTPMATETQAPTQTPPGTEELAEMTRTTVEGAGGGLPPGMVFFAGGFFVLAVVAFVLVVGRRVS